MHRPVSLPLAALALLSLVLFGGAARADDAAAGIPDAAKRITASILKQLEESHVPGVKAVSVQAFAEVGYARGTGLAGKLAIAIAAELRASSKLQVRDADAVAAAAKEKGIGIAPVASQTVQAVVVGDLLGGDAGAPLKAQVKLVAVGSGVMLASESAILGTQKPVAARPEPAPGTAAFAPVGGPRPVSGTSSSVDVAMRKVADQLMAGFNSKQGQSARYARFAVMPFSEVGSEAKKRELGAVVTAELSTSLRRDHGALLVERQKLVQVMGEIKLGNSGAVDPANAPEIGKLSDAQALVLGSVAEAGDRYLIDARIVSTETAETLAAASEAVPAASLVALSSDAVVLRSKKDAAYRSFLIAGWGQVYNREPAKGWIFPVAVYGTVAAGVGLHFLGQSAERAYKDTTTPAGLCAAAGLPATCTPEQQQASVASLKAKAESRYSARNVVVGVAVSLWVLNILDAYVSGIDGEKLLGGAAAFVTPPESGKGASAGVTWAKRF